MAESPDPFDTTLRRRLRDGGIGLEELALANRNSGIALETLRHDVTPQGLHYLLIHFDIPDLDAANWRLEVGGAVAQPLELALDDLAALPQRTLTVTLECAGNGRAKLSPRHPSMPWLNEAVGTAEWTGVPLRHVLERAGLGDDAVEIAFFGADAGFDQGQEHFYGRSLKRDHAFDDDVLLVHAMNGSPLPPQHGAPLRLLVPGWYGMASVKWLTRVEALRQPFEGYQQAVAYHYRRDDDDPGVPVSTIRVKSLMVPPGVPDWFTRARMVEAGAVDLFGRAWSGAGTPITRVEVGVDGVWSDAELDAPIGTYAWRGWRWTWQAEPGRHQLACRAHDANGEVQPLDARWDRTGMGNNAVHRLDVTVK